MYSQLSVEIYDDKRNQLQASFVDKKVAVGADETTDAEGRQVVQIILYNLQLHGDIKPKLIATINVDKVDFSTLSSSIIQALSDYKVS